MSRTRDWRRAQRDRVRYNRRAMMRVLWGWSFRQNPEWIEESARKSAKVNPFTACSCWMCQYEQRKEIEWDDWEDA